MADRREFSVSVVTPDGPAYEGDAQMIIVPGAAGEIGVLARHAPLIATLKAGSTRVHLSDTEILEFATGPGFFQVLQDRAIALVDDAVDAAKIDADRAQAQLEAAQAELEAIERGESTADRWQVEQRIRHAENQLAVAGR
ncbi:MAG TPA: ATP synthase F1 subunit epsilon [Gaiellaceae bacterium]